MKNPATSYRVTKFSIFFVLTIIGVLFMANIVASAAPVFRLGPVETYFLDLKTRALMASALAGNLEKAKWLVTEGANPDDAGPPENPYNQLRPLHYAIAAKNQAAVKVLIAVGADPELVAVGFGSAFNFTMTLRDLKMMSYLLDLRPINTLAPGTIEDLIFESEIANWRECLDLVFRRGAPVDFPDGAGYTIMIRAIEGNDFELAEWLIQKGASVLAQAPNGMTPAYSIQYAVRKFKPGSPPYKRAFHLQKVMEARGATFPAPTPDEVVAKRGQW